MHDARVAKKPKDFWHFCLYVAKGKPRSIAAIDNLKSFCDEVLPGRYKIDVIDLAAQPKLALQENISALPLLVRKEPKPILKVVGDLSNRDRLMVGMDLLPYTPTL